MPNTHWAIAPPSLNGGQGRRGFDCYICSDTSFRMCIITIFGQQFSFSFKSKLDVSMQAYSIQGISASCQFQILENLITE